MDESAEPATAMIESTMFTACSDVDTQRPSGAADISLTMRMAPLFRSSVRPVRKITLLYIVAAWFSEPGIGQDEGQGDHGRVPIVGPCFRNLRCSLEERARNVMLARATGLEYAEAEAPERA